MKLSSISVVIPTFKASAFIRATLESVFAQTQLPGEVIVVDDCSQDDTVTVVEQFAKTAPVPIRVIRLPKNSGGPAAPLNAGIEAADCDIIATLDHDDLMDPRKLEMQAMSISKSKDCGISICKCRVGENSEIPPSLTNAMRNWDQLPRISADGPFSTVDRRDAYEALHLNGNFAVSCSGFVFPKSVWRQCNGFDEGIKSGCDFAFLQQIFAHHDVAFVDLELYTWHRGDSNLSSAIRVTEQLKEGLMILGRFDPNCVARERRTEACQKVNRVLRSEINGLAYGLANCGMCFRAFYYYCVGLRRSGFNFESIGGMFKILPKAIICGLRRLKNQSDTPTEGQTALR